MYKNIFLFFSFFLISNAMAASANGFETGLYGFIKTSGNYASQGLASFNNINLSAPTHAVAQTRSADKTSRFSVQTQQTRIGLTLSKTERLSGRLEFDFIDFNKSSPTTQMSPRVRIASITYNEGRNTLIFGQDWDLFSPVTTYTFDIVGLYFLGGNTGFMRQQFQYLYDLGEWEVGSAIGMAGNNPGTSDNDLETSKSPSYSARILRKLENGKIGLSAIYARLTYHSVGERARESYGLNAFFEKVFGNLSVKSEFYYAQNLANIGSLSIGKGTSVSDVKEYGGTLTGHYRLAERTFIFGGTGLAKVDNSSELTPFTLSATDVITSPGIKENIVSRIGVDYRVTDDLSWITELSRYNTVSKLQDNKYQLNVVGAIESGVQLRF